MNTIMTVMMHLSVILTVLKAAFQFNTIQYNTIQFNTTQYNTIRYMPITCTDRGCIGCASIKFTINSQ